jgi:hypothetical protein
METTDFLASVKSEVLANENEDLPFVDFDPPLANPGCGISTEILDIPIAPVNVKVEHGALDDEVTLWNVQLPHENAENPDNGTEPDDSALYIDEHDNDPDFPPDSENESDAAACPDHDYTPMAGVDPSNLTHIEILDCQQDSKKGFRCPHCLYTTKRRSHFETHIVCHSDEKPFQCNKCDFRCVLLTCP